METYQLFEHEQSAKELARTLVLGEFGLYCVHLGLREAPSFEEDAGMGLYHYIKPRKTHWANGQLITAEDQQNYAAADALVQFRGALTLEPASLNYPPSFDLFQSSDNPWSEQVSLTLARTALYNPEGQPSLYLQTVAPFLREVVPHYQHDKNPRLHSASRHLPRTYVFGEMYGSYQQVADEFLANMPKVDEEAIDAEAFWESIENFDPSTTAPLTPADNSWAVEDIVRDVPVEIVQIPWYRALEVYQSAAYLKTLLGYLEELNTHLR